MGWRGMSIGSLILIAVILLLIFGTRRLRNMGEDLGRGVKSFRKGLKDLDEDEAANDKSEDESNR